MPRAVKAAPAVKNGKPDAVEPDKVAEAEALELLVNEVATEGQVRPDLPEGAARVPLYGKDGTTLVHEFVVLHPDDWPSSANEDPEVKRYYSFALKVLATDEDKDMWRALDPTNRQCAQFVNEWIRIAGQDPKDAATPSGS